MGSIKIPLDRIIAQTSGKAKADAIQNMKRSNKGSANDIMSFPHYYKGFNIEWGVEGPEMKNGKAYLSVYHFLEYEGIDPKSYDTFSIGEALSQLTVDRYRCKYEEHDFHINKYDYNFLKQNMHKFNAFRF